MQERIVSYIRNFSWNRTADWVRRQAVKTFADTVAVMAAGAKEAQVRQTAGALQIDLERTAGRECPVIIGYGHRAASLTDAVLLNAVSAHSNEYNDLFFGLPGHPSAVLVPVVLGLGEKLHKSGAEVLEAYLCGMEVLGRVNEALMPGHHQRGFHSTSTAGIIGACAAAGKLLHLEEEKLHHAVSMACTFACGLRANLGCTCNSLHVGNAAAGGLRAALYAAGGIAARENLLELPDGYFSVFYGNEERIGKLGERLEGGSVFQSPGVMLKRYPVCFSTYQAIDAAKAFRQAYGFRLDEVEQIACLTSPHHYLSLPFRWPENVYEQRFCVPFCVCFVLNGGEVQTEAFSGAHYREESLFPIRERLVYGAEEEQKGQKGVGTTLLRVKMRDGRTLETRACTTEKERVEHWTQAERREKFVGCVERAYDRMRAKELWKECGEPEQIEDVAIWMDKHFERRKKHETDRFVSRISG